MQITSKKISAYEIDQVSKVIKKMGGELIDITDGESCVFKFDDVEKMLVLVNHVKSDKRLAAKIRVNSKIVDGSNILTLDRA